MILRRSVTKIWILTSLLALLFSSSAVGAEIKPGTSCPKVNATKVLKGLKYTCIKSGKKLIWSKGVKFSSKPTTSPSSKSYIDLYTGVNQAIKSISTSEEFSVQTSDGRNRSYKIFVPQSLVSAKAAPLVIALHGGLGSASQFESNSGLSEYAGSNGFYVVYPNGIGAVEGQTLFQTWNAGDCCGLAAKNNVNDVSFIRTLINTVKATYPVDSKRIFVIGHSNGAMLAYRLACELSDQISGIGVQAGSLGVTNCNPSHPISVIHIHGTSDTNFPIDGGVGSGVAGVSFRPARFALDTFALANKCETDPEVLGDQGNSDLSIYSWRKCQNSAAIRYIIVNDGTHAWMGHPAQSALAESYVGAPYKKLDSTRALLSFLLSHPRP